MPGNYPLESGEDEAHAPRATLASVVSVGVPCLP